MAFPAAKHSAYQATDMPERFLSALALAAICLITFANVLVRYFTNISFAATEELTIALMVVMTLLGTAAAYARDRHIAVEVAVERLPAAWRRRVRWLAWIASLAMFGLLVWYGGRMAWDDYRFEVTSPGLGLPQWWYTVWLPVLAAVVMLRLLWRAAAEVRA